MGVVTVELEVTSLLPAAKLFKVYSDFDTLGPKVEPETYKAVDTIEGNGDVGTIKTITYGEGVPFTSSKHKVDAVDANNFSLTYTIFEGDVLMGIVDSANHCVKFVPSADGGSMYKHTAVFSCKGDNTIPEDTINLMKEGFKKTFKGLEFSLCHCSSGSILIYLSSTLFSSIRHGLVCVYS